MRGRSIAPPSSSRRSGAAPGASPGGVLVVRPGALGDAVLTLPVLHALRGGASAGARPVTVLGNPASWDFLRPDAPAACVHDIDSAAWLGLFVGEPVGRGEGGAAPPVAPAVRRLLARIEAAIVYLGGASGERVVANLRALDVANVRAAEPPRAGAASRVPAGPAGDVGTVGGGAPASVEGVSGGIGRAHAAYRLLAGLAIRPGPTGGDLRALLAPPPLADDALLAPTAAELAAARRLLPGGDDVADAERPPFLVLHPGSGGAAKCWPAERFAALAAHAARTWGLAPVVLFGPADAAVRGAFVAAAAAEGLGWMPVAGRPLREVLGVLSLARAYVGNDSGITHLAARACPTLALFGPSEPEAWRPLGREVAVLRAPDSRMDALAAAPVAAALARLLTIPAGDGGGGPS